MSSGANGKKLSVKSVAIKGKRVVIALSNGDSIDCSIDAYTEFRLYAGKEVTSSELKKLKEYVASDDAYSKALVTIASHPRTVMEIRKKLIELKVDSDTRSKIVARLKENGLLDDKQFAIDYAEELSSYKHEGKLLILKKLKDRGIDEAILAKLQFSEKTEKNNALSWMDSLNKRYAKSPNSKKYQQCKLALRDKGFEPEAIEFAMAKGYENNPEREDRSKLAADLKLMKAKYEKKYEGYALRSHLFAALARKGYDYDDINNALEDI